MNKGGKARYPCLVSDLSENTFSFQLFNLFNLECGKSYRLVIYCVEVCLYCEECSPYTQFVEHFYHE